MNEEREQAKLAASLNAGVPMGGVGAGCIEMGRDGRFRNVTINNNRTVETRIPVSRGGFVAVRAAQRGRVLTRILQADSDVRFQEAGVLPTFTSVEQMAWRGLYPRADYQFSEPQFPIDVRWTALSPIIPYDIDASTLPVVFFAFDVRNLTEYVVDIAVVFNWENLCGCTRTEQPLERGVVRPVMTEPPEDLKRDEDAEPPPPKPIGLEFGYFDKFESNAHGNYCLLAYDEHDLDVTLKSWNETDLEQIRSFWRQFHDEGRLDNQILKDPGAHSGAVCCAISLPPGGSRRIVYGLSWFCPRFEVRGVDQGNVYAVTFANAHMVSKRALKYHRYFFKSVESWHNRFLSSSLPRWFNRMLINNNYVLSTNTLLTKEGKFAMFETPEDPVTGALDRRFHSSLGTLLFFPALAISEIELFAKAEPPDAPGRLYRYLGKMCLHQPEFGDDQGELMDLNSKFILMVYRDYHLTGRMADLRKLYPRLKQVMAYVINRDLNHDGLPEAKGFRTTYDNWKFFGVDSYSGSIWVAAIRAFAELSRSLGRQQEAAWCDEFLKRAQASFEKRLWNEKGGYYYFHDNADAHLSPGEPVQHGCASGQLAGQWYADFLGLGCLFPTQHVKRALEAIFASYERGHSLTTWPALHSTHYACLEITHGNPDRGLHSVQKAYKTLHVQHGRAFNQPLCWDLSRDTALGWGTDRHMSAPAMWHVLFALQGFLLNVPDQELWIRPNLPRGVHTLTCPLFTPLCFGGFTFQESDEGGVYRQMVRLSFDSPVQVQTVVLRVPPQVQEVKLQTEGPVGCEAHEHNFGHEGDERLIEIRFKQPITLTEPLQIRLAQTQGAPVAFPKYRA